MNPLVSVIIPVYNVEMYVEKCMRSLLSQTYKNFEALIVDDGSPDDSIKIAKEIVGEDSRFIFFEQNNGGQGAARNLALDNAKGEFIAFLDSDDYYEHEMLAVAVKKLSEDSSVDVLSFGINYVDEQGRILRTRSERSAIVTTRHDILLLEKTTTYYFWDKVYRRRGIMQFRFSESIRTYEDVDLIYQVLYGCKVKKIPNRLYNYVQREGSTVRSLPDSFFEDKRKIVDNSKIFLIENGLYDANKEYYERFYLMEMVYKPLTRVARYSSDYRRDIVKIISYADEKKLSFRNLLSFRKDVGLKGLIISSTLKINISLIYSLYIYYSRLKAIIR